MTKLHPYRTPFIVGLPVLAKQFFGRQNQVETFFGQCILGPVLQPTRILGLRRSGKTSFLNYVADHTTRNRFLTRDEFSTIKFVYVNAQTIHSRNDFYCLVANTIHDQIAGIHIEPPKFDSGRAFEKWLDATLRKNKDLRIIVLIDEFEILNDIEDCGIEFFRFLRALASGHQASLTWVTASAVDLYTLDKRQKTSPFWNIFHQMPIIMGGFDAEKEEAETLIRRSLETVGSSINKNEINEILAISGRIPYFVQAVADAWHKLRENKSIPHSKMRRAMLDMLSNPGNQLQHIYQDYWDGMSQDRKLILKSIASERRNFSASLSDLSGLVDYGLIVKDRDGGYAISGQLLKQFVMDAELNGSMGTAVDARQLFELIYATIDKKGELRSSDKADLKHDVEELQQELLKGDKLDQSFVRRHLRSIGQMAPDILEVTLATIANPAAGFGVVAKKIADKIKENSNTQ